MASVMRFPEAGIAEAFPVAFTPRNAARAIDEMLGEPYGWGGASGFRDCSAMTRDYFSLFGVWLPRNSADQSVTGARMSLKNTPSSEKTSVIVPSAVPFATLVHMPGHIMLYLGVYNGEPVVFHNTWGVRTNSGRAVVGQAVVTSLKLGSEIKDKPEDSLLIDRIDSFSFPMADLRRAQWP
jgi:cell wall-associated NlpC family hydrolase